MDKNEMVGEVVVGQSNPNNALDQGCGKSTPFEVQGEIPAAPAPIGTVQWLIDEYRSDRDSPYRSKRWPTRQHYDVLLKRVAADFGTSTLEDIRARQLKRWHEGIVAAGHVAMGHGLVGMIRTIVGFGATILEDKECQRLAGMLHLMKFAMAKPRTERLTAEQAILIRREAHSAGRPSIALAQAIQFECFLRQKDVIGEWVPETEPGESAVRAYGNKWLRGIRWEEISHDFVLSHITSKRLKLVEFDLTSAPMVVEELHYAMGSDALGGLQRDRFPKDGPVIFSEASELPWIAGEYRRWWRKLARSAGIPDAVRSMDSRAGAITEATDAGASLEHIRHASTHSDIAMVQRYSRGAVEKVAGVQKMRNEHRNKAVS